MKKLLAVFIVTVIITLFSSCVIDERASKEEIKLAALEEWQVGKERRFMESHPSKLPIDTGHAE